MQLEFDWDPAKAAANVRKHKVAFDDAMSVFADPLALSKLDQAAHSEERWLTLGQSNSGKLVLVGHTYIEASQDRALVRIISAHRPTKREKRDYEQT